MRIGVIVDNDVVIDMRVLNEVHYLKSIGHEVHVLCPSYSKHKAIEVIDDIYVHRFNLNKSLKNLLFGVMNTLPIYELFWINKVRRFVKKVRPQVLHANDLYMAKIAYRGGKGKLPVVLDLHENYPAAILAYKWSSQFPHRYLSLPHAWRRKERKYLGYANKIVVLSNAFKATLINRYPSINPDNIFVYPNVPNVKLLLSFPIISDIFPKGNRFVLFYFGGVSERRGIYTCFEAIKILSNEIPNIHLLIIGPVDGNEQSSFNEQLHNPILKEKVTHYSWKGLNELPSYVLSSDVCLSPIFKNEQHESGVANKVFQYLLFGKPLIVSDCTPQIEIVERNGCGVVFRSNDAIDLAAKIKYLYDNPQICTEMGERGKKAVLEKYNLEVCGKQLELLYKSFPIHITEFK